MALIAPKLHSIDLNGIGFKGSMQCTKETAQHTWCYQQNNLFLGHEIQSMINL